jgi:hypothetical protein
MSFKTPSAESYKNLQQDATLENLYSSAVSNTPINQTTTRNPVFQ